MCFYQCKALIRSILSPLAILIASGFCVLFSSFVYAEQEWRILLVPVEPVKYQKKPQVNKEVITKEVAVKRSQKKPFDYGVIQPQITVKKPIPSNDLIKNIHYAYNESIEHAFAGQLISANYEVLDKALLLQSKPELKKLLSVDEKKVISNEALASAVKENMHFLQQSANLMVRYQLQIQRKSTTTIPQWQMSLTSVVLDVFSKKQIESHEETFTVSGMPVGCIALCEQQWFIQQVKKLARDAGAVLAKKLNHLPRRYHYTLTFYDFNAHELYLLQQLLSEQKDKVFSEISVNSNEYTRANEYILINEYSKESTISHLNQRKYRYVSLLPSDQLDQLFNAFFIQQQWQVTSRFEKGNIFTFTRKRVSSLQFILYLCVGILIAVIILALVYLWLKQVYRRKQGKQQRIDQQRTFDLSASNLINQLKTPTEPYQALSLIDEFLFTFQEANNKDTATLEGFYLKKNLFYKKLITLRAHYSDKITPLKGDVTLNNWYVYQLTENKPVYIGREPLSKVQQGFIHLPYQNLLSSSLVNVNGISAKENTDIPFFTNTVSLSFQQKQLYITSNFNNATKQFCLFNGDSLTYKVPKKVIAAGNELPVNSLFNNKPYSVLSLGKILSKTDAKEVNSVLNSQTTINVNTPCQLLIKEKNNNVLLVLDETIEQLYNTGELVTLWPNWYVDLAKKWVLQTEPLAIGLDSSGDIAVGCFNNEKPIVWLHYSHNENNGYSLSLAEQTNLDNISIGNTLNNNSPKVFVNNISLYGKVPLSHNTKVIIKTNNTKHSLTFKPH